MIPTPFDDVRIGQPQIAVETTLDDDGKIIFFPRSNPMDQLVQGRCSRCGRAVRPAGLGNRSWPLTGAVQSAAEHVERRLRNEIDRFLPRRSER